MSNGAHALTEADLAAVREVWDTMDAANTATDWDTYQQHLTQDLVALDPRVAGPLRGRTAWREWIDSLGFSEPEIQLNVEEISGSGDVACIVWTGEGRWIEGARVETNYARDGLGNSIRERGGEDRGRYLGGGGRERRGLA